MLEGVDLGPRPRGNLFELLGLLGLDLLQVCCGSFLLGVGSSVLRLGETLLRFLEPRLHFLRRGGEIFAGRRLKNFLSLLYRDSGEVRNQGLHFLDGGGVDLGNGHRDGDGAGGIQQADDGSGQIGLQGLLPLRGKVGQDFFPPFKDQRNTQVTGFAFVEIKDRHAVVHSGFRVGI